MTVRDSLKALADRLPEEKVAALLDFGEYLAGREGTHHWQTAARQRFAEAYGSDEPEYSESDVKCEARG